MILKADVLSVWRHVVTEITTRHEVAALLLWLATAAQLVRAATSCGTARSSVISITAASSLFFRSLSHLLCTVLCVLRMNHQHPIRSQLDRGESRLRCFASSAQLGPGQSILSTRTRAPPLFSRCGHHCERGATVGSSLSFVVEAAVLLLFCCAAAAGTVHLEKVRLF